MTRKLKIIIGVITLTVFALVISGGLFIYNAYQDELFIEDYNKSVSSLSDHTDKVLSSLDKFQETKTPDNSQFNKSIEVLNESKNIRRIQGQYNPKFNNITKNFNKVTNFLIEVSEPV